jgi:MFS family permease
VPFGLFVAFNYKEYGGIYIKDDYYLSVLGSIGSVGNGVFRMFWGILMDLLPFRKLKYIVIAIFIVSCATIKWAVQTQASYLITVLIVYGAYGGLYSIYPTQTVRMLGRQLGPKLYYITFLGFSSGAILQYIAHKFLVEKYHDDGYTYCFIIFGALLFVALALIYKIDLNGTPPSAVEPSKV